MNVTEYEKQFEDILEGINANYPYDSDDYINYVKMNQRRMKRWDKVGKLSPELTEIMTNIDQPMNWVLITEPWCGDAAHSHSFIKKTAELNPNISLTIQNRDTDSEIDNYLTNGGKAIPILIARDTDGNDLFVWGPRPKEAQDIVMRQKNDATMTMDDKKIELQKWYNKDKGTMIQNELNQILKDRFELV
ncbi:MAG: hypothetical protein ACI94Y_003226 [Maribacter sp.]|jgi:hypothetical protein